MGRVYGVQPFARALDGGSGWQVMIGNHTRVALFDTLDEAQREAARLNHEGDHYSPTGAIGLDGVP